MAAFSATTARMTNEARRIRHRTSRPHIFCLTMPRPRPDEYTRLDTAEKSWSLIAGATSLARRSKMPMNTFGWFTLRGSQVADGKITAALGDARIAVCQPDAL